MDSGLPVLLSDIPPQREILDEGLDGSAGWVVPDGGWVEALQRVASADPAMLALMGDVGRSHVQAERSWDAVADATVAVYRRVLGQSA
jgi:glycosyltransferase involved in cell wall biosynthesis